MRKILLSAAIALFVTSSAMAFTQEFVFKGRGGIVQLNDSIKTGSKGTAPTQKIKDGWLGEIALDYLLTKNIGFEFSAGYGLFDITNNQNTKRKSMFVPITGTAMLRLPMYEQFFPYIGAGYSYRIISGTPSNTKVDNGHGVVFQAGLDFFFEKTNQTTPIGVNIDLKYHLKAKHKITEKTTPQETFSNDMSAITILGGVVIPF